MNIRSNDIVEEDGDADNLTLSADALVRSIGVRRNEPIAVFLGAGASTSSGVPSADMCVWDWKRQIFLTNNPGLEEQFSELSLEGVRRRIQAWLDRQASYPIEGTHEEYSFYIRHCFPIAEDRRAFFAERVKAAAPHIGYRLLGHLAQEDLIRSVWTPNFDCLAARSAASFKLAAIEVGIDSQSRVKRLPTKGELLCVSMHGDYRYDELANTEQELQTQQNELRSALVAELIQKSVVVSGYSGRDKSLMDALYEGYSVPGAGTLYWCGFGDGPIPKHALDIIQFARAHGRQAFYITTLGFDDLFTRIASYCLQGEARQSAFKALENLAPKDKLARKAWDVAPSASSTLIKSNAFSVECPSEMLSFNLKEWPSDKVFATLREVIGKREIVAVPFKGRVFAFGTIDQIKDAFADNIRGTVDRTPVGPKELSYEDGAISGLMRETLTRAIAGAVGLPTDYRHELWRSNPRSDQSKCPADYVAHDSLHVYLRRCGDGLNLVLMPSIKVFDKSGTEARQEIANPIKLAILGYQHNKQFNQALMSWRKILFPDQKGAVFEYPANCGSGFRFKVRRSPAFGRIGVAVGGTRQIPDTLQPLIKYTGIELTEPQLVFSNKSGSGLVRSPHPIRGVCENRPYDFALTTRGFLSKIRLGVVCAGRESRSLHRYLLNANRTLQPSQSERDYLVDYPGFQTAFGLPLEFPDVGESGWFSCPEPTSTDPTVASLELASHINRGIETLQSSFAPHVVLICFPKRWQQYRGFRNEQERFDVHDFVKAFCVQRGIATQFFDEETFDDGYQARVWWWLSLALYVKSMRTPWVLDSLTEDTAFVGLGYSVDINSQRGNHIVLGCSHIYSGRGEGLQYRLTKIEDPVWHGKNPFMSRDDARRTGETIRQLFFDARHRVPDRVVLHKRTEFTREEREGLADGLGGVKAIDMLEIQKDSALRFVASIPRADGTFDDDNYPVRRGTAMKLDDYSALVWVHGATTALSPNYKYFQGKRRIPAPLIVRRHAGHTDLKQVSEEILGLSKMNWNTFDLYTKLPATLHSSNAIARIGTLLERFGAASFDYRLFM